MFRSRALVLLTAVAGLAASPMASARCGQNLYCQAVETCYGNIAPGWGIVPGTMCSNPESSVCVAYRYGGNTPYYVPCTEVQSAATASTVRPADDAGLPSVAELAALTANQAPFSHAAGQADDWTVAYGLPPRATNSKTPTVHTAPAGGAK